MNTIGLKCSRIQDQQILRKGENRSASTHLQSVTSAAKFVLALARWAHRPTPPGGHLGDEGPPIVRRKAGKYGRIWNVLIGGVEEAGGRIYGSRAIIAPQSHSSRTGTSAAGGGVIRCRPLAGNNDVPLGEPGELDNGRARKTTRGVCIRVADGEAD